jgi:hypothetical protein
MLYTPKHKQKSIHFKPGLLKQYSELYDVLQTSKSVYNNEFALQVRPLF